MHRIITYFKSKTNITIDAILLHLLSFSTIYYLLLLKGSNHVLPADNNLLNYDAYWYYTIKQSGYQFVPNEGNGLAFFPLFPLVWQLFRFGPLGISFFNLVLFIGSFWFLLKDEKLNLQVLLLLLSFPTFVFFALPYSESLFFLFGVFIVVGYKKESIPFLFFGFFGASMIRSVSIFFIPAILICEVLNFNSGQSQKQRLSKILLNLSASLSGFLIAAAYMGITSGKWFYFIEIQKYWHRHWLLPLFPLTTNSANRMLAVDGIAFIIGTLAIYCCARHLYSFFKANMQKKYVMKQEVLFSALFLSGVTIIDTFFTYNTDNSTNIWSISRHLMSTPFAVIFLIYLIRNFDTKSIETKGMVAYVLIGVLITGVYRYLNLTAFFLFFFYTIFFYNSRKSFSYVFLFFYLITTFIEIKFYEDFLYNQWIG